VEETLQKTTEFSALTTLDELYKKDLANKASGESANMTDVGVLTSSGQFLGSGVHSPSIRELDQKPKEVWLKCPLTKNHCDKAECSFWIVTYQRCCFVSIAKGLDILTQILDDRIPIELKT